MRVPNGPAQSSAFDSGTMGWLSQARNAVASAMMSTTTNMKGWTMMTGELETSDSLSLREHLELSDRERVAEWLCDFLHRANGDIGKRWWPVTLPYRKDVYRTSADSLLALLAPQADDRARLFEALWRIRDMAGTHTVGVNYDINDGHPAGFGAIYRTADAAITGVSQPPQPEGTP